MAELVAMRDENEKLKAELEGHRAARISALQKRVSERQ